MEYSIKELADLAGVSARTLRYYDKIGLLKPARTSSAGYRFYSEKELITLQQILFYKERGFGLERIYEILYKEDFDIMSAFLEHLSALEQQKLRTEQLICTVKKTIASLKGDYSMNDKEKFEAFKKQLIDSNERRFGSELREKYGSGEVDAANEKILAMDKNDYDRFQSLETEIIQALENAVLQNASPNESAGEHITKLHKAWLCMTWKTYTPAAHIALAESYVSDSRFTDYYDKNVKGCAAFLKQAIACWAEKL